MDELINQRIAALSNELEDLMKEREAMQRRDRDIETRTSQLVGAIYELQQLLSSIKTLYYNQKESNKPNKKEIVYVVSKSVK